MEGEGEGLVRIVRSVREKLCTFDYKHEILYTNSF